MLVSEQLLLVILAFILSLPPSLPASLDSSYKPLPYLNALFNTGLVDSFGVRYFYTEEPPEIRAGIFPVGYSVVGHMIIPPNVERYTVTAFCNMDCTNAVSSYTMCNNMYVYNAVIHYYYVASYMDNFKLHSLK